jgi:hypothetical protein
VEQEIIELMSWYAVFLIYSEKTIVKAQIPNAQINRTNSRLHEIIATSI